MRTPFLAYLTHLLAGFMHIKNHYTSTIYNIEVEQKKKNVSRIPECVHTKYVNFYSYCWMLKVPFINCLFPRQLNLLSIRGASFFGRHVQNKNISHSFFSRSTYYCLWESFVNWTHLKWNKISSKKMYRLEKLTEMFFMFDLRTETLMQFDNEWWLEICWERITLTCV